MCYIYKHSCLAAVVLKKKDKLKIDVRKEYHVTQYSYMDREMYHQMFEVYRRERTRYFCRSEQDTFARAN